MQVQSVFRTFQFPLLGVKLWSVGKYWLSHTIPGGDEYFVKLVRQILYTFGIPLSVIQYRSPIVYSLKRSNNQFYVIQIHAQTYCECIMSSTLVQKLVLCKSKYQNLRDMTLINLFGINRGAKHVNFLFSSGPKESPDLLHIRAGMI